MPNKGTERHCYLLSGKKGQRTTKICFAPPDEVNQTKKDYAIIGIDLTGMSVTPGYMRFFHENRISGKHFNEVVNETHGKA